MDLVLPLAAGAIFLTSCAPQSPSSPGPLPGVQSARHAASRGAGRNSASQYISHVVVIIQENRSIDNLFQGYPGADTASKGKDVYGNTVRLQPRSLSNNYSPSHTLSGFLQDDDNGNMDG